MTSRSSLVGKDVDQGFPTFLWSRTTWATLTTSSRRTILVES